jgi:two-component system, NtrC family, nitrogen regulation sensor histidine kinase NtrY
VVINLLKNAVEAALDTNGGVRVSWQQKGATFEVHIEDDGRGLANTANLFVPFFTTKPSGSGIGLLLCRQIAENHGGSLSLRNRDGATGCLATLRLPV